MKVPGIPNGRSFSNYKNVMKLSRRALANFSNTYLKGEKLWSGYQGYGSSVIFLKEAKPLKKELFDLHGIDSFLQKIPAGCHIITDLTNFISLFSEDNKTTLSIYLKIVETLNISIPKTIAHKQGNIVGYLNKGPFKFQCIEEIYLIENFPGEKVKVWVRIIFNKDPSLKEDMKNFMKWLQLNSPAINKNNSHMHDICTM